MEAPSVAFPVQSAQIYRDHLEAKRSIVLETIDYMPAYLNKPEVLALLDEEKRRTYQLILNLMWITGALATQVPALKHTTLIVDEFDFGVKLKALKQRPSRPTKAALQRSPQRYIPITVHALEDRIQSYLYTGRFKKTERIFPMCRQTVNRHFHALVERIGDPPFAISAIPFGIRL
ncbi:MAG: hypothetical protein OIF51_09775 [Cellvibrionaceae bacterium]|nr:hypothetical protein [Cellvibrionaceae bacterium]